MVFAVWDSPDANSLVLPLGTLMVLTIFFMIYMPVVKVSEDRIFVMAFIKWDQLDPKNITDVSITGIFHIIKIKVDKDGMKETYYVFVTNEKQRKWLFEKVRELAGL